MTEPEAVAPLPDTSRIVFTAEEADVMRYLAERATAEYWHDAHADAVALARIAEKVARLAKRAA